MKAGIGVVGCGTVGAGVADILRSKSEYLRDTAGVDLRLVAICDKDKKKLKGAGGKGVSLESDWEAVIQNNEVDIVVELIGGTNAAFDISCRALEAGKPVVTANKALIATRGVDLFAAARKADTCMAFEAAVCAGVPVIAALRDALVSNNVTAVLGIVNGTSNYVLSRMAKEGATYKEALKEAKSQGFAEADPTLDVEGIDSAHKIAILSRIAFGADFDFDSIYTEGITCITPQDIEYTRRFGYVVKLLAVGRNDGALDIRVHPALLPEDHLLSFVDGPLNAVCLTGDAAGDIVLQGTGAGRMPTASAVVADIVDVALGRAAATFKNLKAFASDVPRKEPVGIENVETRYYVRFSVVDKPGVLAKIAGVLGRHDISIASVIQMERDAVKAVPLVMMTHQARERDMRGAMDEIDRFEVVREPGLYIRVER